MNWTNEKIQKNKLIMGRIGFFNEILLKKLMFIQSYYIS